MSRFNKSGLIELLKRYKLWLIGACICCIVLVLAIILNYLAIGKNAKYIKTPSYLNQNNQQVGVVLGGGIENNQPRPLLQDRLNTAATLLKEHKVKKLLVSGDNRYASYNEPKVMKDYLVKEKGIDPSLIAVDYGGRSTYETCERARKVYGLNKAVFISESTHLPRVLYLCRSFGIEAYGISSDGQSSAGLKVGQRFREILARTKAGINVYILGEKTVLGDKIAI
jgi:SanA protein